MSDDVKRETMAKEAGTTEHHETAATRKDEEAAGSIDSSPVEKEPGTLRSKPEVDEAASAKLRLKLDLYLLPIFCLLYMFTFLDRINVGNANVVGFSRDLRLRAAPQYEYQQGLMLFYIVYALFMVPSNLILQRVGAWWLGALCIAFGCVTISTGFIKNFSQFMAMRALLGITEAGMIPGIAFILSRFYRRHELVFRIGMFLSMGPTIAGAFGGLLAAGIVSGTNLGSVTLWGKIFVIEGIMTVGVGLVSVFYVPSSPEKAWFLSAEEKALAAARISQDSIDDENQLAADASMDRKIILRAFTAPLTWGCALMYSLGNIIIQGTTLFLPTIVQSLGTYTNVEVQLRTVPQYFVAGIWAVFVTYYSFRTRRHGVWIAGTFVLSVIGYIMVVASKNSKVRYGATFLTFTGADPGGPLMLAWATSNSSPATAKSTTSAIVTAFGTLGACIAPWAYLSRYSPDFLPGNSLNIGATSGTIVTALLLLWYVRRENTKREQGLRDYKIEGLSKSDAMKLGDSHPAFKLLE